MVSKLYIIGNGFDLHHNLKTRYHDFAIYLKKNNADIYDILESFISYSTSEKDLWSKFEENLANLDVEAILHEHSDRLPDYSNDDFRDRDRYVFPDIMDELLIKLTKDLFSAFKNFIQEVVQPNSSFEQKIDINEEAIFLTFNYTNTLERVYHIDRSRITYIHNSAFYNSEDIILGHGINPESFEVRLHHPPNGLNPDEIEKWYNDYDENYYDFSYDEGKNRIMEYFKETFKPTREIIKQKASFFKQLNTIEEIFIFGHSLSKVDLPYFKELVKHINTHVKWTVSYYNNEEYNRHEETLNSMGISSADINFVKLDHLKINNKQLSLFTP